MAKFDTIQLYKDKSIGIGSYGAVCKAKCDDLWCAAKVIHPTLVDPMAEAHVEHYMGHRMPIRRFEQECEFLSTIRHPNIVQFLGLWQDPESGLPVLLMELMDQSLTHYLENSPQQIPFHIQVDICHDIAQALSFLHNNNIIHRDLSGNNVLLIGCVRAKVTDFGMARLADLNPQTSRYTFTMCPGTDTYMPPEAVKENPTYSKCIDCFSFGVLVVQILTRQFPKPGERLKEVKINHPDIQISGTLMLAVPEVERRQNHISQIDPNHSLMPVALDCLKDKDVDRPSSQQLCERILSLQEATEYGQSKVNAGVLEQTTLAEKDREIMELQTQIDSIQQEQTRKAAELEEQQSITQHLLEQLDHEKYEMRSLSQNFQSELELRQRNMVMLEEQQKQYVLQIEDLEKQLDYQKQAHLDEIQLQKDSFQSQLDAVNKQLELTNKVRDEFGRRIHDLEVQLHLKHLKENKPHHHTTKLDLRWNSEKNAPIRMRRFCDAVVNDNKIYCIPGDTCSLFMYDKIWHHLPNCINDDCTLVVVQSKVTTVGGHLNLQPAKYRPHESYPYVLLSGIEDMVPCGYSDKLYSLVSSLESDEGWEWAISFLPMPTERSNVTAVCVGNNLIVAGGEGRTERMLDTVELMMITTRQWFTATSLPEPLWRSSASVIGGQLYMLGGTNCNWNATNHVYTCSPTLATLLTRETEVDVVWEKVSDVPVTNSTCVSLCDQLLAIGGRKNREPITSVHQYDFDTNSWKVISHMGYARCDCFAAVLSGNQLVVVGGDNHSSILSPLDSYQRGIPQVELAYI